LFRLIKSTLFLGGIFDIDVLNKNLNSLKEKTSDLTFWSNNKKASAVLKNISRIEKEIKLWEDIEDKQSDVEILFEFYGEGEISKSDVSNEVYQYKNIVEDLELKLILGKKEDTQDAIITIHPGAGGTESQDWVQMLYRMYGRWAEKK